MACSVPICSLGRRMLSILLFGVLYHISIVAWNWITKAQQVCVWVSVCIEPKADGVRVHGWIGWGHKWYLWSAKFSNEIKLYTHINRWFVRSFATLLLTSFVLFPSVSHARALPFILSKYMPRTRKHSTMCCCSQNGCPKQIKQTKWEKR